MAIIYMFFIFLILYFLFSTLHFNFYVRKKYGTNFNITKIKNDRDEDKIIIIFIEIRIFGTSWRAQSKHILGICSNGFCIYSKINNFYIYFPSSSIQSVNIIKSKLFPFSKGILLEHDKAGIPQPLFIVAPLTSQIVDEINNLLR